MQPTRWLRKFVSVFVAIAMIQAVSAPDAFAEADVVRKDAKSWPQLNSDGVSAFVSAKVLWLRLDAGTVKSGKAVIPRLCSPIRSVQ